MKNPKPHDYVSAGNAYRDRWAIVEECHLWGYHRIRSGFQCEVCGAVCPPEDVPYHQRAQHSREGRWQ